jgi:trigger factor
VKITQEKIENRQAYLTVEMEQADLDDGLTRAYNRLVRKYAIPGFRKGKTPRPVLEQYLGKPAFLEEAVEVMAPDAYEKAVKQQDLKPIARPEIQLEKTDPVVYKFIVPLEPAVKLGDYKQIKLTPDVVELKEEDVNKTLEELRHQHSIWEPVDRQVNIRDMVILDIESQVGAQPFINQKDAQFQVEKDSEYPIKGFAEELIGLKKSDTKEFKLTFAADYARPELAGKDVAFKINIKDIKQEKLPEVDDDFVKLVNPEFKSVEELKTKVGESIKKSFEEKAKRDFEQKVVDAVVEQSTIEYPAVLVEDEIDQLINDQMRRWQMDEKGLDEYLKSIQRSAEQLREELRPVAIKMVKQSLAMTEVAKAEGIEVNVNDVKEEVEGMTREVPAERKETLTKILTAPQSQVNIASAIATRKTVSRLTDLAQGIAVEPVVAAVPEKTEKVEDAENKIEGEVKQ